MKRLFQTTNKNLPIGDGLWQAVMYDPEAAPASLYTEWTFYGAVSGTPESALPKLGKIRSHVTIELETTGTWSGVLNALAGFSRGLTCYTNQVSQLESLLSDHWLVDDPQQGWAIADQRDEERATRPVNHYRFTARRLLAVRICTFTCAKEGQGVKPIKFLSSTQKLKLSQRIGLRRSTRLADQDITRV